MIKKIPVKLLEPGMYVSDFNAGWLHHPFAFNSMMIATEAEVARVVAAGIRELYIDTERGRDVGDGVPTAAEAERQAASEVQQLASSSCTPVTPPASEARVSLAEEMNRARLAFTEAVKIIRNLMEDVRLGRQIELATTKPSVEKIVASVMRNSNAMMTMRRLKNLDDYTFLHSVSVCTMLVSFAKVRDMDLSAIHDVALGGLIHDIGKMRVAQAILNKPKRLNEEEFRHIKSHVVLGSDLVRQLPGIPPLALEPLEQHHERFDGSGYPRGLKGEQISEVGRMSAIVDVYDAITSDRTYRKAMSPAAAVQKLFEWSQHHFDPAMTKVFLKSVGIYPIGTLVRLESGRLGVVIEQCDTHLLTPVVRVMYDGKRQHYIVPEDVDLAKPVGSGGADSIVGFESAAKMGIDVARFLQ
jgi:HD-GYP domain-containing protein (c-di-GMP phosphodiesterase class II)